MKTTSCGILVLHRAGEILLCHATGTSWWDIPKGGRDDGETEREAALRETVEETGLAFEPARLLELGRYAYRRAKDLYLFAVASERVDVGGLVCSTHFRDFHGRLRPEMDAFAWTPFDRVGDRCAPAMVKVLTRSLSLAAVLQRVIEPPMEQAPVRPPR